MAVIRRAGRVPFGVSLSNHLQSSLGVIMEPSPAASARAGHLEGPSTGRAPDPSCIVTKSKRDVKYQNQLDFFLEREYHLWCDFRPRI